MLNFLRRPNVESVDIDEALAALGLDGTQHVVAHSSLRAFGHVEGGPQAVVDALLGRSATLVAPAFSYYTLLSSATARPHASFHKGSRVSPDIGRIPQTLVESPGALRSGHPALSFVGQGERAQEVLGTQTLDNPYAPIGRLYDLDGLALLIGVDHRSNTSIHYGEYLAGMPLLTRYVEVGGQVRATAFPNCSADFERLAPHVGGRTAQAGKATIRAYRVRDLVDATHALLTRDPEALLCTYPGCRCQEVRRRVRHEGLQPRAHGDGAAAQSARSG